MIPKNNCLDCGESLWDDNPPVQPKPGNQSICIYCGCVTVFTNELKLTRPIYINSVSAYISAKIKFFKSIGYSKEQIVKMIRESVNIKGDNLGK